MNGERVGTWATSRGVHELTYAGEWLESPHRRPVSLSLPLLQDESHRGPTVQTYFENLVPDSDDLRHQLARRVGARGTQAFELLEQTGAESAGALQILMPGQPAARPAKASGAPLDESAVAEHLRQTFGTAPPSSSFAAFRISLAGAHAKAGLLRHDDKWWRPHGGTPTTHIFKPPLGAMGLEGPDLTDSVENEWLCGQVLRALGFPVAESEMLDFEDQRVLAVTRFDRALTEAREMVRLPQEDLCQALAHSPQRKYESDGGPGIKAILRLLEGSASAELDRRSFFATQVAFWMLAAIDGHAKNFSVHLEVEGRFRLTPLYDVLSARPVLGRGPGRIQSQDARMAMALWDKSRHYHLLRIGRRHFHSVAKDCRISGGADPIIRALIERVPGAIARVSSELPASFPSRVAEPILDGLSRATEELDAMPTS